MTLRHLGTVPLETDRLILRPFTIADAPAMFQNWANSAEVARFLSWQPHTAVGQTEELLAAWVAAYDSLDNYNWGIVLKGTDQLIGGIGVVESEESIAEVSIGYCIGQAWWNQGVMSDALEALIGFFFAEVGVNRISASHIVGNPASGRVMLKCGMRSEGTRRQGIRDNEGRLVDDAIYAILAEDYRA